MVGPFDGLDPRPVRQDVTAHRAGRAAMRFSWRLLFGRRWLLPTGLILLGMAGLAQLGLWQLDRLASRRAHNERIRAQLTVAPLRVNDLQDAWQPDAFAGRVATAAGVFDYARQVGLKNRFHQEAIGIHLFAPFRLADSGQVIMVNRGWIPQRAADADWSRFDERAGAVEIAGYLEPSAALEPEARGGRPVAAPDDNLWHREDLETMAAHLDLPLAPMFLVQEPAADEEPGWPRRQARTLALSEGNHFSYALQWFAFALILGVGYVLLVRKRTLDAGGTSDAP